MGTHETPSRLGRSLSMSTPIRFDPKSIDLGGKSAKEIENLYWGGADESFEVPDFHFDWGVVKPADGTTAAASTTTTTPSSVSVATPGSDKVKKPFSRHVSAPLTKGPDERPESSDARLAEVGADSALGYGREFTISI